MIHPTEIYEKAKVPVDEKLVTNLLSKYLNIDLKNLQNLDPTKAATSIASSALYAEINMKEPSPNNSKNSSFFGKLYKEAQMDCKRTSSNYDPRMMVLKNMVNWYTFKSWDLLGTEEITRHSHRFYFPIKNERLYELSYELYNRLKKANIPFYFKVEVASSNGRTDNIVLYASTKYLQETLEVIEKLSDERKDLMNDLLEPSILTGKLIGNISYGSEKPMSRKSYTSGICNLFIEILHEYIIAFMNSSIGRTFQYEYKLRVADLTAKNIKINDAIKIRTLTCILYEKYPNFIQEILTLFRKKLTSSGYNINNLTMYPEVQEEIFNYYGRKTSKMITIKNGKKLTLSEYFDIFDVYKYVPANSIVKLKNGQVFSGEDFIKLALNQAHNFNSFEELVSRYCKSIEEKKGHTSFEHK